MWSELYSALSEMIMNSLEVRKVLRIDYSRKFPARLKMFTADGKKEGTQHLYLLFLVQNECGQIVARAFTKSENNKEAEELLRDRVLPRVSEAPEAEKSKRFVVSDNANAIRHMIGRVFGELVTVN